MVDIPVSGPTTVVNTIPTNLYVQYDDDANVQSFLDAYNAYVQGYLNYTNNLNLPIYSNQNISGPLLDWVLNGLYGFPRPGLPVQGTQGKGDYNTYRYNKFQFNQFIPGTAPTSIPTTDDVYKRCATWKFYKGDGRIFTPIWLKRRIHRFLNFPNGTSGNIDNTYDVSVVWTSYQNATITVPNNSIGTVFQAAVTAGVLELPFQTTWTVVT